MEIISKRVFVLPKGGIGIGECVEVFGGDGDEIEW